MIHISKLDQLPKAGGVYFLISKRKKLVYIGKAKNLKHRLTSHRSQIIDFKFLKERGREVINTTFNKPFEWADYILIEDPIIRSFSERELIKQYLPPYNFQTYINTNKSSN